MQEFQRGGNGQARNACTPGAPREIVGAEPVTAPRDPPPQVPPRERVIHVDFERGRRVDQALVRAPATAPPLDPPTDAQAVAQTVARTFTRAEVAEMFALPARRLRAWERLAIVVPSGDPGSARATRYTFSDLLAVRAAKGLTASGFSTAQIRAATDALRAQLPDLAQPLTDARLGADGKRLVARRDGARFDATTGQLVFDFDVRALRDDVVRVLRPKVSQRQQEAWRWYLEGLRLDEDETARGRAEEAYRKAIALDPHLATALTNLGNLRLTADHPDEAEALYRRAMAADPNLAEAPYNLAYLLVERGEREAAVALFEQAIALRPEFAEAHYNLAMALTELGDPARARPHWRRYLDLDPHGPWSTLARQRLGAPIRDRSGP